MREDGRSAKEACEATVEENPAALVKRRRVSRHEDEACGDPGKAGETVAGAGGLGAPEEPLEVPVTDGGGPETMASRANMEPLR